MRHGLGALSFAASLLAAPAAQAALVYDGAVDLGGTGIGAVQTVLTIQGHGSRDTEQGWVGLDGSGAMQVGGDAKTGASQTRLLTFGDLGLTSADALRIVFNANEPAGGGISLDSLVFNIYSPNGSLLFSTALEAARGFGSTASGIGNSGFAFSLDAASAAAAQAFFGSDNYIGLSASASDAQGGFETFFIANAATPPVPEPQTYALLLAGLGVMGLVWRRSTARQ